MTNQIEILKLGSIHCTTKQHNGLRRLNIVCDGGHIFDFYNQILIKHTSSIFEFYETEQIFVGGPFPYNSPKKLVGVLSCIPLAGQPITMNQKTWQSSIVTSIINDCIIVTRNSVYALHNLSKLRDDKIQQLGI